MPLGTSLLVPLRHVIEPPNRGSSLYAPAEGYAMLLRFVFVTGMTIGVMASLVWVAYVAVPSSKHTTTREDDGAQRDTVQTALREKPDPKSTPRLVRSTSLIAAETVGLPDNPEIKSNVNSVSPSAFRFPDYAIDLYVGSHLIVVCSELARIERQRLNCP